MRVFPDIWVKKPKKEAIITRRRIPEVLSISIHDCFACSNSILMVDWI